MNTTKIVLKISSFRNSSITYYSFFIHAGLSRLLAKIQGYRVFFTSLLVKCPFICRLKKRNAYVDVDKF